MSAGFPEILAPAGNREALEAAVRSGADAVYLGSGSFHARQGAANFEGDQLTAAIDYCHLHGVSVYLTLNTLVSDREQGAAQDLICFAYQQGIDAVIVQDLGVAKMVRETVPTLPLHASTQMTVYNIEGMNHLKQLGFKRAVLARELSLQQIREIVAQTDLEIEIFVHGAICVSYSGQCLMSSFIGGRSGNRGRCAQPCRLPYSCGNLSGTLLSPKDLCLIDHLTELKESKVASFKIEGRMKGPEYVSTVVGMYRRYLDSGKPVTRQDYEELEGIFYRGGFTDGYLTGKQKDMLCLKKPDNPYAAQKHKSEFHYERKIPVSAECRIAIGQPLFLKMNQTVYQGEVLAEQAQNRPLTEERVRSQLEKLGGTNFHYTQLQIELQPGAVLPVSELNNARRSCIEQLERDIIQSYKHPLPTKTSYPSYLRPKTKLKFSVYAETHRQYEALKGFDIEYFYLPFSCDEERAVQALPVIGTPGGANRILISNIGQIVPEKELFGGYQLNIFNNLASLEYQRLGISHLTLSPELTLAQIFGISGDVEAIGYGYLPLMTTENCLMKCKKGTFLKDRTGETFRVRCLDGCRNEILNSRPIYMGDKLADMEKAGINRVQLRFTDESPEECAAIFSMFQQRLAPDFPFTRGKFYKSV